MSDMSDTVTSETTEAGYRPTTEAKGLKALFLGLTNINFVKLWKTAGMISLLLVLISLGALIFRGLNLGIEFEGGQSWQVASSTIDADGLRDALTPLGLSDARIQEVGNDLFRVRAEMPDADSDGISNVSNAIASAAGVNVNDINVNSIGGSWGEEITSKARNALIIFFIVLFIYIAVRLEWKMAVGAMVAVLHDIIITVGIYALFQFEVTAATVIAFLTILGYSLYDTLVVFDKVKENESRISTSSQFTYSGMVSYSLNQVLMRSINTTITSVLPVLCVLIIGRFILGAVTLQEFAIALLVGLIVGTYSSLFVATPIVAWLKEREEANVLRRQRIEGSGGVEDADSTEAIRDQLAAADRTREIKAQAKVTETAGPRGVSQQSTAVVERPAASGEIPARPRKKKNR